MQLKRSWTVKSEPQKSRDPADLRDAGRRWNSQIQVTVTRPAILSNGPVVRHILPTDASIHDYTCSL